MAKTESIAAFLTLAVGALALPVGSGEQEGDGQLGGKIRLSYRRAGEGGQPGSGARGLGGEPRPRAFRKAPRGKR